MTPLPIAQWRTALDRMEAALASAGRGLARAEERWELAVAPSAGEGEPPVALDRLDARLLEWGARLRAAEELSAAVEEELVERAAAVEKWRATFARWEELLKQSEHVPSAPQF
jgi:hypothetical protein